MTSRTSPRSKSGSMASSSTLSSPPPQRAARVSLVFVGRVGKWRREGGITTPELERALAEVGQGDRVAGYR
jgi:hypothetical protein